MLYSASSRHGTGAARVRPVLLDGRSAVDAIDDPQAAEITEDRREWRFPGFSMWLKNGRGNKRTAYAGGSIADAVAHSMKAVSRL